MAANALRQKKAQGLAYRKRSTPKPEGDIALTGCRLTGTVGPLCGKGIAFSRIALKNGRTNDMLDRV